MEVKCNVIKLQIVYICMKEGLWIKDIQRPESAIKYKLHANFICLFHYLAHL